MADQTFRNVINGESVDSVSGQTYDVIDPTTGEVYAQAPMSGSEDVDRAYAAADAAFEAWGRDDAEGPRRTRCSRSPTPSSRASTRSTRSSAATPASRSA